MSGVPAERTMRDVFIEQIYNTMPHDTALFFVTADFGAPGLDALRAEFGDRFVNVGIAEQNLINVSMGLALEGFTVFAYAIAPFMSMRAFDQIRNLSLHARFKKLNVNLISVGAGISYDISGPTHHCIEDISLMRLLPHIDVVSPSDWTQMPVLFEHCRSVCGPKYLRLDSKPLEAIGGEEYNPLTAGFIRRGLGKNCCLVATGYATRIALKAAGLLQAKGISAEVIDFICLKRFDSPGLREILSLHKLIATVEEGLIGAGGLDSLIADQLIDSGSHAKLLRFGFTDHAFENGGRECVHARYRMDEKTIASEVRHVLDRGSKGFCHGGDSW